MSAVAIYRQSFYRHPCYGSVVLIDIVHENSQ
jgi:hypothetical protein